MGSDLDPVRLAMARVNVPGVPLVRADALAPVTRGTVLVADPARRTASGRRTWRPADFVPPLDGLAVRPGFVSGVAPLTSNVRIATHTNSSSRPPRASIRHSCPGRPRSRSSASTAGCARRRCGPRGSRRPGGGRPCSRRAARTGTVTDAEDDDCPVGPAGEWIVDPDGAVVRAGLVRQYGARHGLWRVDEHLAYLTGDAPPPGVRAFRVLEHGRYSEKTLRTDAAPARDVGRVEILVRGLDVDPNALRPRLKLGGLAGGDRRPRPPRDRAGGVRVRGVRTADPRAVPCPWMHSRRGRG